MFVSKSSPKLVFSWSIRKTKMFVMTCDLLRNVRLLSKRDRKQELDILYHVSLCVFRAYLENRDVGPSICLAETFPTSRQQLNRIWVPVKYETEMKRNRSKRNKTKRNRSKRNETNDTASHCGQKSVFYNIRKSFSNIRN